MRRKRDANGEDCVGNRFSPDVLALNPGLVLGRALSNSPYRSQLERRAAAEWLPAQLPLWWAYEPLTFHTVGGTYTPDFVFIANETRELCAVEVKGWNKNLRADKRKFRECVNTYPWARWCWLMWEHGESVENWST